jgi:hypothetical protein
VSPWSYASVKNWIEPSLASGSRLAAAASMRVSAVAVTSDAGMAWFAREPWPTTSTSKFDRSPPSRARAL